MRSVTSREARRKLGRVPSFLSSFCESLEIFISFSRPSLRESLKVMLHETIRNDDFERNTALQHCCDIVSNGYNIVPALRLCAALKEVTPSTDSKMIKLLAFDDLHFVLATTTVSQKLIVEWRRLSPFPAKMTLVHAWVILSIEKISFS